MTTRSIPLCLAVLTLACGPGEATTTDADTSGTTDSTATTDDGTSTTIEPNGSTSSSDASADAEDTAVTTESGVDETTGASSESGGEAARDGRFDITAGAATIEPVGCAAERGAEPTAWTIEFMLPTDDGAFAMVEMFGPYVGNFDCTLAGDAFTCTRETIVDYAFMGKDAIVRLASTYDAGWDDDDGIVGTYDADFTCEGEDCASVVDQWQLTAFPCGVQVQFTGALAPGR